MAFTGTAAAANVGQDVAEYTPNNPYQGQDVTANASEIVEGNDYTLRVVDDTDNGTVTDSTFVKEITANSNDSVIIETERIDAGEEYFLTGKNLLGDGGVPQNEVFEVREQTLDVAFDDDEVSTGDESELDLETNRGSSDLIVHANGDLDQSDLENIFTSDFQTATNFTPTEEDDLDDDYDLNPDDAIILEDVSDLDPDDNDGTVNFTDIDEGEYEFQFDVSDTDTSDSASISVTEEDISGDFSEGVYTKTAGDIQEITLELEDTDDGFIQIGSEEAGYVDIIEVSDEDDDDEVTFEFNTRLAGTDADTNEVYESEENEVLESAVHDGSTSATFEDDNENSLNFTEYLEAQDLVNNVDDKGTDQLTRPMQPADYDLIASADSLFVLNSDDESEADDEIASGLLELTAPELGDITTHVAPEDDANEDDELDSLLDSVTQRDTIAEEDRLIIQVEATGLYGAMANKAGNGNDIFEDGTGIDTIRSLDSETGEGINFVVEAQDATGNQDPTELNMNAGNNEVYVIPDNDGGQFFVIADTSSDNAFNGSISDGVEFEASLEYETDDDNRYEFNGTGAFSGGADGGADTAAYPYFQADSTQETSATFEIAEPEVTFDNVNVDGVLEAENIEDAEISGTTNVAPGTDSEIQVSSTDASTSFRSGQDVNISEDGEITAEFDFSDQEVDEEFETSYQVAGSSVDSVDSVLVEEGSLSEEAPEDDESEDDESDDGMSDDSSSDDGMSDDGTSSDDSTEEETPGFGALVALVAVLGAALLATRRQN